ncbi:MAG: 50S ribosomal protein L25 [Candidatus Wildermuthbacteria bacterium]|nr:50S ribosomal protein L25 [Candidatus Wildermuthbacteria bacterium]
MLKLSSKIRASKENVKLIRTQGYIPAVLYGPATENLPLSVDAKEFKKLYDASGESTLISLDAGGKSHIVLIHDAQYDPLSGDILHVDFYQPRLDEEINITVPVEFDGEAPAVKDLGGTLIKHIQEIEVRALPQDLPHEIRVDVAKLATFEDRILVQDLPRPQGVTFLREPEEIVASVATVENVEEELAKPIEEGVEKVELVAKEVKKEEKEEAVAAPEQPSKEAPKKA